MDVSDALLQRIVAGNELMARQTERNRKTLFSDNKVIF